MATTKEQRYQRALDRIARYEYRSDRRHKGMVGVEEIKNIIRIATVALYRPVKVKED